MDGYAWAGIIVRDSITSVMRKVTFKYEVGFGAYSLELYHT